MFLGSTSQHEEGPDEGWCGQRKMGYGFGGLVANLEWSHEAWC